MNESTVQSPYNERFKRDWIELVVNRLGLEKGKYDDFLSKTYDDFNMETNTQVYNSFTHDANLIDSKQFWYESPNDVIYGENGVMMWKTHKKESLVKIILAQNINVRQVFKKLKNKADSIGDKINFDKYKTFESLCKLMINGSTTIGPQKRAISWKNRLNCWEATQHYALQRGW